MEFSTVRCQCPASDDPHLKDVEIGHCVHVAVRPRCRWAGGFQGFGAPRLPVPPRRELHILHGQPDTGLAVSARRSITL